jgi:two-component system nitrogen regulation response regulator GlnG
MAPAQVIECKDLPPEVLAMVGASAEVPEAVPAPAVQAAPPTEAQAQPTVAMFAQSAAPAAAPLTWAVPAAESPVVSVPPTWESGLQAEAQSLLEEGRTDVWDVLTRRFETRLIQTALQNTRGRRIEAAQKLGIGRNTITRKIQELGME